MSYRLNSTKRGCIGDNIERIVSVMKGDTRSFDKSLYELYGPCKPFPFRTTRVSDLLDDGV